MGLQSQLNDVSSESIPLLLVAIVANCVSYLRSLLFGFLQSVGLSRFAADNVDDGLLGAVGSGLAGLMVLAEQLNLNRVSSYRYADAEGALDCVVCLCGLSKGEQVRMLECRHVFHKECFDRWLDHLKFSCPLCRSSLVSDERVALTERRVGGDLISWFTMRCWIFGPVCIDGAYGDPCGWWWWWWYTYDDPSSCFFPWSRGMAGFLFFSSPFFLLVFFFLLFFFFLYSVLAVLTSDFSSVFPFSYIFYLFFMKRFR